MKDPNSNYKQHVKSLFINAYTSVTCNDSRLNDTRLKTVGAVVKTSPRPSPTLKASQTTEEEQDI